MNERHEDHADTKYHKTKTFIDRIPTYMMDENQKKRSADARADAAKGVDPYKDAFWNKKSDTGLSVNK